MMMMMMMITIINNKRLPVNGGFWPGATLCNCNCVLMYS
jgi:hypothetical protein